MANFLFVLSKDDNEAATRCFQFAKIAHTGGHHVDLFFIDGRVYLMGGKFSRTMEKKPTSI